MAKKSLGLTVRSSMERDKCEGIDVVKNIYYHEGMQNRVMIVICQKCLNAAYQYYPQLYNLMME